MSDVHSPGAIPRLPLVARDRLVRRLAIRFEVRLTTVVGGGGSGKTTALAQAMAANVDDIDVWYPCTAADSDPTRLLRGLVAACEQVSGVSGVESIELSALINDLCEVVLSAAPRRVCFVLDDTHMLNDFSVIDDLLRTLPASGHILLSGRQVPPVGIARLDAAGLFAEVPQEELLMTSREQVDFANLRGVDKVLLEGAMGWPAFVELASSGKSSRSRRYLEQEAVGSLTPERRGQLAAFAFVGGGDPEIAEAVTGSKLDTLLTGIPLVRWSGNVAELHDLWRDLLCADQDQAEQERAALAASAIYRRRRQFDRAVQLGSAVDAWSDVEETLMAATREGVDGGLRLDHLLHWRSQLPESLVGSPTGMLIDALIERERDPTSEVAWNLFDEAARAFAALEIHDLELVALAQLGYLGRISGVAETLVPVVERIEQLATTYAPARPFVALANAWLALITGQPELQLEALETIADVEMAPVWRVTRDHLIANALMNLGRPLEALERVPHEVDQLPVPIPGALITKSQCLWAAGQPDLAIELRPRGLDTRYGARDRFIAGTWIGLMRAYAGQVEKAERAVAIARQSMGEVPGPQMIAQLFGVELLVKLARGHDDQVAADLEQVIASMPLAAGRGEQLIRAHLAIAYVLVPSSRQHWDEVSKLGPAGREARELARVFVSARAGDFGPMTSLNWPQPGAVAAVIPAVWGTEFALLAMSAGRIEGRTLAEWLCEHWGRPVRDALRSWLSDSALGDAAREVMASTPSPPSEDTEVSVVGPMTLRVGGYPSDGPDWRRERVRALLVWLVLNPKSTREHAAGALWPDLPEPRAAKNLRTTLNYLQGLLEPRRVAGDAPWFVRTSGNRLTLHSELNVDLWRFRRLLDAADEAESEGRVSAALPLLREASAIWRGDLATDLDHEWLELERIHIRSRFVRASCRSAELLVAMGRPSEAIDAARLALAADEWHEPSYRVLADAYLALGDSTAATEITARAKRYVGSL